jgi:hypothetical protein
MKRFVESLVFCTAVFAALAFMPLMGISGPIGSGIMADGLPGQSQEFEYRVLATNRTSTLEKELNEAADAGYRFEAIMGGGTAFGGSESVAVMSKPAGKEVKPRYQYKLLATTRTSTMQKELQQAGDAGFAYRDQTVFKTTFGGKEVAVILERNLESAIQHYEYKLLATSRTSTMEKELKEAGAAGYEFVGMSVGETSIGGSEVISILRRLVQK